MIGIKSCKVASCELICKYLSQLLECRLILYILIGNTCQLTDLRVDGLLRIYELVTAFFLPVRINLDIGNLNNTVFYKIEARSLQIEDDNWFCKIQFH